MTMTNDMSRLVSDLIDRFAGVTQTDLQAKMFNVFNEFLDFTNIWYENISFNLVVGQLVYTLTPAEVPAGRMKRLLVVYDSQDVRLPDLWWVDQAGFIPPSTLQIHTQPSSVKTWVARMAKTVATTDSDGNPALPDWVIQQYRDELMAGVHRELYLVPDRPWSSQELAAHWGKQFIAHKTKARIEAIKQYTRGQTNWMYPATFGRSSQKGV